MDRDERHLLDEKYGGVATPEFEKDKERLAQGEPLAYLIGIQPFLGLIIHLDSRPLIPRVETEWWMEQLLQAIQGREEAGGKMGVNPGLSGLNAPIFSSGSERPSLKFLDLCAGSGAIGCAILKNIPNAQVYFGEIDPVHEQTILKNIRGNSLDESRATVRIGDLFEPFGDMQFNFIAANPPYIPTGRELPESVAHYEPAEALFAGTDGLVLIRRIATDLSKHLAPGGEAWIECDSAHAQAAAALFREQGFASETRNDQYGVPRVIEITRPA